MVRIEVWGKYAAFNRPEFKVERYTYDVITPSAAVGLLKAIYWHPSMEWIVDKIYILSPIQTMSIMRNERKIKGNGDDVIRANEGKNVYPHIIINQTPKELTYTQRNAVVLKDVHYVIEAHFEENEHYDKSKDVYDPDKKYAEFCKRAKKGKCFFTPWLGNREYPAEFRFVEKTEEIHPIDETRDLGIMLHSIDFNTNPATPRFFRAKMENGIIDVSNSEVYQ